HVVLAVNKMDLTNYDAGAFDRIVEDYRAFVEPLNLASLVPVPISARGGDNVLSRSAWMPWYGGPALLEHLETVQLSVSTQSRPLRITVQSVDPQGPDLCGLSGTIACGRVQVGDRIVVARTGRETR